MYWEEKLNFSLLKYYLLTTFDIHFSNFLHDPTPIHDGTNTVQFSVPLYLTTSCSRGLTRRGLWLTAQGRGWSQQWRWTNNRLNQGLPGRSDGGEAQGCQGWWEIGRAWSGCGLLGRCCGNSWARLDIGDPKGEKSDECQIWIWLSI